MTVRLEYTGERFIPGVTPSGWTRAHHLSRYMFASKFANGKRVLDIGSGAGYGTQMLAETAAFAAGCDISLESAKYARSVYGDTVDNVRFAQSNCLALPFADRTFDLVVSFEVIEHLEQQNQMVSEARRVLKPDGMFIVSTPERERYNAAGVANPFHAKELNRDEFYELLRRHFDSVEIYWQTLPFPLNELFEQSQRIAALERQMRILKTIIRQPWTLALRNRYTRKLATFLPNRGGNLFASNDASEPAGESNYRFPFPEHFVFESTESTDSKYMVALCRRNER